MENEKTVIDFDALNALAGEVHELAVGKGFWDTELTDETLLMLVITELAEAVEADRKGNRADVAEFTKPRLEQRSVQIQQENFVHLFETCIKDTVEDELADAAIRLLDFASGRGFIISTAGKMPDISGLNFPDKAFYITFGLAHGNFFSDDLAPAINAAIGYLFEWARLDGVDLMWHIAEKMKYNQTREFRHGKAY